MPEEENQEKPKEGNGKFNLDSSSTVISDTALTSEIDSQLTKKLTRFVYILIPSAIAFIFGGVITSLWDLNSNVNELNGKYQAIDYVVKMTELEKEKNLFMATFYSKEIDRIDLQIMKLESKLK